MLIPTYNQIYMSIRVLVPFFQKPQWLVSQAKAFYRGRCEKGCWGPNHLRDLWAKRVTLHRHRLCAVLCRKALHGLWIDILLYGNSDFKLAADGKVSDIIIPQGKQMLATYFCYMVSSFLSLPSAYSLLYYYIIAFCKELKIMSKHWGRKKNWLFFFLIGKKLMQNTFVVDH